MTNRILVATDGSEKAKKVVEYGADLASKYGATLYLVHAEHQSKLQRDMGGFMESEHLSEKPQIVYVAQTGERIINEAKSEAWGRGAKRTESAILIGDPAREISRFVEEKNIDIIVIGRNGVRNAKELYSRKVTDKIARDADSTCITVNL